MENVVYGLEIPAEIRLKLKNKPYVFKNNYIYFRGIQDDCKDFLDLQWYKENNGELPYINIGMNIKDIWILSVKSAKYQNNKKVEELLVYKIYQQSFETVENVRKMYGFSFTPYMNDKETKNLIMILRTTINKLKKRD